uniref:Uncharacterized protein n=1 Tax=Rhizophora mucronata TaxID=61149 RepID=A0A2P2M9C7_RHIMU
MLITTLRCLASQANLISSTNGSRNQQKETVIQIESEEFESEEF